MCCQEVTEVLGLLGLEGGVAWEEGRARVLGEPEWRMAVTRVVVVLEIIGLALLQRIIDGAEVDSKVAIQINTLLSLEVITIGRVCRHVLAAGQDLFLLNPMRLDIRSTVHVQDRQEVILVLFEHLRKL